MSRTRPTKRYSASDYFSWPDDIRCELIHGKIYDMAPAPSIDHQRLVGELGYVIRRVLQGRESGSGGGETCEMLFSPIDVLLAEDTVVQPDLVVVCDPAKLENGKYVDGPPDLVVEILSPSTALKDRREKRDLYETAGVAEYLIIDSEERYAEYYRLDNNGRYGGSVIWGAEDSMAFALLPELTPTLSELFGWPVPQVREHLLPYATGE